MSEQQPTEVPPSSVVEKHGFANGSMVLGIIALVLFLFWFISIVLAILAIVFGVIALKSNGRRKAITGIVTGSISIALSILVFFAVYFALPNLQAAQRDTARKSDITQIYSEIVSLQSVNQGQLPTAEELTSEDLSIVELISSSGSPAKDKALYRTYATCEGDTLNKRDYSIRILLENGEEYCQGN